MTELTAPTAQRRVTPEYARVSGTSFRDSVSSPDAQILAGGFVGR